MKTTLAILMLGAFDLFFLSKTMHKAMRRAATASAQSYGLGHSLAMCRGTVCSNAC